jgi:hypothetical protein
MKQKLNDKADKEEVTILKKEIKDDFALFRSDLVGMLKQKLESSHEIMSANVEKLEEIFNLKSKNIEDIFDIKIKVLNENLDKLEKNKTSK